MRKVILLLPLLSVVAGAPAYAQVTGRIEVKAGYDGTRAKVIVARTIRSDEINVSGLGVGAEAGVDATVSGMLVGAYAGFDLGGEKGCDQEVFFLEDELCMKSGRNLYAGLRAGLRIVDGGLLYFKGGLSRTKLRASYFDGDDDLFGGSDTLSGYHVGMGFEVDATSNVYLKGEYVHTWHEDAFTDVLEDAPEQGFDAVRHQLMFGVGLRFGGASAPLPPPPPPPPPPPTPVAPATQTCPDGSVILATDMCPLPPPPPPPPPPPSGERG